MTNHEILNCYKLQKTFKKKGVSLHEAMRKNMSEQEKYQMFMEFKSYMDAQGWIQGGPGPPDHQK